MPPKLEFHETLITKDLGCFSDVGIHIDTMGSGDKDYQVTFKVCSLWPKSSSKKRLILTPYRWKS